MDENNVNTSELKERFEKIWNILYPDQDISILENFIGELDLVRSGFTLPPHDEAWYKDAVVYSMYVDLFNSNFPGLQEKLDYLEALGINCLWLLPILESPMKDAGFDISNYRMIRNDLLGLDKDTRESERNDVFKRFLRAAHDRDIRVIFDIALNHTSDQHPWFLESKRSPENPYRDYYIWSESKDLYKEARIIFQGLCESNWERHGDWYYFHRFFEFQPDLNYKNPQVLLEMSKNLLFWLHSGVDGFRADAIPYIWKEDGTNCENLPQTHEVVRFFRAVLDYIRPNTLLLAEACQKPHEVVKYFGDSDECHAGYHFPLMPQIFKTLSLQSSKPVTTVLSPAVTPEIPEGTQWFTFLRCHDELSLELVYVSEEDRKYIHDSYCKKPEWDFREGQGISARLADLLDKNPDKIALAYSIMLTLPGTPVIYYGDEFGKTNDYEYYKNMIKITGKDDTRFLVRGRIDWKKLSEDIEDQESYSGRVFSRISKMINSRRSFNCFGRGSIRHIEIRNPRGEIINEVMGYYRTYANESVLILQNLSSDSIRIILPDPGLSENKSDVLGHSAEVNNKEGTMLMKPLSYYWFQL